MRHCARRGQPVFVLWLDAHADFNTPATSPSGNVHGMPLAALCGEPGFPPLFAEPAPAPLPPADVHLFGLRSIDAGERALVTARRVGVTDMRTIDEFGVVAPLRQVLDRVAARGAHLHVSLDIDFLDPSIAPAVGTTVPGGATFREAHLIMEMLHDSGLVRSLDVVELNPFLDERGRSAGCWSSWWPACSAGASSTGRPCRSRPFRQSRPGAPDARHSRALIRARDDRARAPALGRARPAACRTGPSGRRDAHPGSGRSRAVAAALPPGHRRAGGGPRQHGGRRRLRRHLRHRPHARTGGRAGSDHDGGREDLSL